MDDNEKKRIKVEVVEQNGESVLSMDPVEETVVSQPSEEQLEPTPEASTETDNIISEETKETSFEEAHPIEPREEPKSADIGIMQSRHMEPERKKGSTLTFVLVMVLVALVVALLAGGVYVYTQGTSDTTSLPDPTPSATEVPNETPEPSSTPTEKVDVSKLKVSILNGSGKIGEAGKVKAAIEKAGFKVASTGNAATFDFEETVIQVKASVSQSAVTMLKDALAETYEVEVGEALKDTNTSDIVITVGSK